MQQNQYDKEPLTAVEAQRLAQEIAFGPIVFQVSRLMLKFGIFQLLADERAGMTQEEISKACELSSYATQVLLEASLTIGTVLQHENRYRLAKAGWFLLNDKMVRVNMDFNHDVNYLGMFHLEEALTNGRPEGLKVFGEWSTIYEGLSSLPSQVQRAGSVSIIITRIARLTKLWRLFSPVIPRLYWMWEVIPVDGQPSA